MDTSSPSGFQALEDGWSGAEQALADAEASLSDALRELRKKNDEPARARLTAALEARRAAQHRIRQIVGRVSDKLG